MGNGSSNRAKGNNLGALRRILLTRFGAMPSALIRMGGMRCEQFHTPRRHWQDELGAGLALQPAIHRQAFRCAFFSDGSQPEMNEEWLKVWMQDLAPEGQDCIHEQLLV